MSDEYIFGAHILEILTRGMYEAPRTIFREYVQNSCDAIDAAMKKGILQAGEGRINIWLDDDTRTITISDNGTGIRSSDFRRVMGSVADSDKRNNENRGFRGIGRLCGMAYCKTVIFTAKFRGENVISRLECNGGVLSQLLQERDSGIQRYTASEVLAEINEFSEERTNETDAHYFIVQLENINPENTALLDDYSDVKDYLSYTAPVPYSITFDPFGAEIHSHAKELGLKIDEYDIFLNDEQIFKPYSLNYSTSIGGDEIFDVAFHDFSDDDGNIIAWMWFGLSCFRGVIKKGTLMRGIRLRRNNIQIGDEYELQKLFEEDRGTNYFIGELFCVYDNCILNLERTHIFNDSSWSVLESQIKQYFTELKKLYYDSSRAYNLFKKADDPYEGLKARADIEKLRAKGGLIRKIVDRIETKFAYKAEIYGTESYAQKYTPRERAIMNKIFDVIRSSLDDVTAERLIKRIRSTLK